MSEKRDSWWCCKEDFGYHEKTCENYNDKDEVSRLEEKVNTLTAERDRLREELKEIASFDYLCAGIECCICSGSRRTIAEKALKGENQ